MSGQAGIGHNQPPSLDFKQSLSTAEVKRIIDAEIAPLKIAAATHIKECAEFLEDYPIIETDEDAAAATERLAAVNAFFGGSGLVERKRDELKRPIIDAGNAIGSDKKGPFYAVRVSVEVASAPIKRLLTGYNVKKEEDTRKAAKAEADRLANEARLAEQSADRGGTGTMEQAIDASTASDAYRRIATSAPADLTRIKGDAAGTSSLKWTRHAVIVEAALVPRTYCIPSQSLIDAARGAAESSHDPARGWKNIGNNVWQRPHPDIPGVVLRDGPDLTVRR